MITKLNFQYFFILINLGYGQYGYTGAGYNTWNYNQGTSSPGRRNFNTRYSRLDIVDLLDVDD